MAAPHAAGANETEGDAIARRGGLRSGDHVPGTMSGATAAAVAARRKSRRFTRERGAGGIFDILSSIRTRASGLTPGGVGQYKLRARWYDCAIRKSRRKKNLAARRKARLSVPGAVNRRTFTKAVFAGFGAAGIPHVGARAVEEPVPGQGSPAKQLRIGCTSLVWNTFPRSPETLEAAVRDMSGSATRASRRLARWSKTGTRKARSRS